MSNAAVDRGVVRLNRAIRRDPESAAWAIAAEEEEERRHLRQLQERRGYLYTAGRILLAVLFLVGAVVKATNFAETRLALDAYGIAMPGFLLTLAIGIELVGGALLALGYKVRGAGWMLMGYLAAVTVLMHLDFRIEMNRAFVLSNLAFAGGLMMLVSHGPGRYSLERYLKHRARLRKEAQA
jgi:putative oxidoreductase